MQSMYDVVQVVHIVHVVHVVNVVHVVHIVHVVYVDTRTLDIHTFGLLGLKSHPKALSSTPTPETCIAAIIFMSRKFF